MKLLVALLPNLFLVSPLGASGAISDAPPRLLRQLQQERTQQPLLNNNCLAPKYSCDLRNGESGTFVCESLTHPFTGEVRFRSLCVPTTVALTTEMTCGCCSDPAATAAAAAEGGNAAGLDCPIRPDYVTLTCDASTQPDLPGLVTAFVNEMLMNVTGGMMSMVERNVICRKLVNPFTGEEQWTTMIAPVTGSIEGDTCGCCEEGCPAPGEPVFSRPELVQMSCAADANNNYEECDLPPSLLEGGDEQSQGFFVCREFYDPRGLLVETQKQAVCISESRAWENDECGCCGEACPERTVAVDSECTVEEHGCELMNGDEDGGGVFVCRTVFHPLDGIPRQRGFCIPPSRGWLTDTCGCCEDDGCPDTPEGGFADETVQMASLALEVPDDYGVSVASSNPAADVADTNNGADGGDSGAMTTPSSSIVVLYFVVTAVGILL